MAKLKKYNSFEALKSSKTSGGADQSKSRNFMEFEAFLKHLKSEYDNKKKTERNNEK